MTEVPITPALGTPAVAGAVQWKRIRRDVRSALRRPVFWFTESAIVAISVLHYAAELSRHNSVMIEIHQLLLLLYVFPIILVSARVGRTAAVLAAITVAGLAIPSQLLGNEDPLALLAEALLMVLVLFAGLLVSASARHEHEMRNHAEELAARLRETNGLILRAQEAERLRIARELHDDTLQRLVHLSQRLDAATTRWRLPQAAREELADLRTEVETTATGVRRFSRDLRPAILDDLGLIPALRWLADDMTARTGIHVTYRTLGEPARPVPDREDAFFRITQEALRNIEHHSRATSAKVSFEFTPFMIRLTIEDDGDGFLPPQSTGALVIAGKLGIAGMAERAELVDARFQLLSTPGQGTTVIVTAARVPRSVTD